MRRLVWPQFPLEHQTNALQGWRVLRRPHGCWHQVAGPRGKNIRLDAIRRACPAGSRNAAPSRRVVRRRRYSSAPTRAPPPVGSGRDRRDSNKGGAFLQRGSETEVREQTGVPTRKSETWKRLLISDSNAARN